MATWSDPEVEAFLDGQFEVLAERTVVDRDCLRARIAVDGTGVSGVSPS